jgi:ABC-2 type transport system permease protein
MAITTIVMLVAFAAGSTILSNRDASLSFDSHTNTALVGLILLSGMLCLLGYGLGLIIRNSAASVTLLVLWPLLLENLARIVLAVAKVKNPTTWLPYQSAMRMISTPDFDGAESGGLATGIPLAIVVIVIIGVGIVINERRDA